MRPRDRNVTAFTATCWLEQEKVSGQYKHLLADNNFNFIFKFHFESERYASKFNLPKVAQQ